MKIASVSLLLLLLPGLHANTVLLSDSFSGSTVDPSKWTVLLPLSTSSVFEGSGSVTTTGRGILATANGYSDPYIINGDFTMLSDLEHFNIAFRTDLSTPGAPYYEREGMLVSFSNDGNEVSIQQYTSPTDWNKLASVVYPLVTGQRYSFSIFDSGTSISLAVDGASLLTTTSTYSTGDHIAFYSREFSGTATSIDDVNVVSVPDSGATILYLGLSLLSIISLRLIVFRMELQAV